MLNKALRIVVLLIAVPAIVGCANRATADLTPGADLGGLKKFYVVKFAPDQRGINLLIVDRLEMMGYSAQTGLAPDVPKGVDAVVTYEDKWMWDIYHDVHAGADYHLAGSRDEVPDGDG